MKQLFIPLILIVFSCNSNPNSSSSSSSTNSCENLEQQVKQLKSELNSQYKGYIGHDIYLNLKDSNEMSKVISILYTLKNVKGGRSLKSWSIFKFRG